MNNYGFNVERRIKDGEWNKIGFVEGNGNSNSPKQYSYVDKDLFAGGSKLQYRLKQVDSDGQFEYSDAVEIEIVPTEYELSQNYPNPFNPSTTIRFSLPKETQLKINIYNMLGELVQILAEGKYEAGYHKVTFNASSLPSGAYIYRIESSNFVQVRKMVLIK
ncbi:MAG: T9SS type A sorting domain-containing protein [Ignavibacteriales bacterium]|nr:T9SS type A sorting domain-containing protein [Ignavibacteriales bacterium]